MKTSVKTTLISVACLIAGCCAGYLIANIPLGKERAQGDISKVDKYSKKTVSKEFSAYQEELLNSQEEMEKAEASLTVLAIRAKEFANLVEYSTEACKDIEELEPLRVYLESVSSLARNAGKNADDAVNSFIDMNNGNKKAAATYETSSQNLILTYMMMERQMKSSKEMVQRFDSYLLGKNIKDNIPLAIGRDMWVGFFSGAANLDNDLEGMKYWDEMSTLAGSEVLSSIITDTNRYDSIFSREQIEDIVYNYNTMPYFLGDQALLESSFDDTYNIFVDEMVMKNTSLSDEIKFGDLLNWHKAMAIQTGLNFLRNNLTSENGGNQLPCLSDEMVYNIDWHQ